MNQPYWPQPFYSWYSDIRRLMQIQTVFLPLQGLHINQGENFEVEITATNLAPQPTLGRSNEPVPHVRFLLDSISLVLAELHDKVIFKRADGDFKSNTILGGYSQSFKEALVIDPGQSKKWRLEFQAKDNYVIPLNVPGSTKQQQHIQTLSEYRLDYNRLFRFIETGQADVNITPWWGED